ncbi:DUF262 domain-containing protein [Candidatus Saccharibacteria bacterium]|nr:DUF262 domain-containing protein [Candidatus Saccharibacteria bacterium]
MKIAADSQSLISLVSEAKKGKLVLPEFQRSFVWPYNDVKDLLVSIFKGYFIGSVLLLDADSKSLPFAYRTIEGVGDIASDDTVENYLLDGQQRITTLHYVLYAPAGINLKNTSSPYRFLLNLAELKNDKLDNAIYGVRERDIESLVNSREQQFKKRIIPFTVLASQESWSAWCAEYVNAADGDEKGERALEIMDWNNKVSAFLNFTATTLTIDKVDEANDDGIAEICAVFEKMNNKGVKLTVFDLLTARLYRSNISLRKLWIDTYQKHEHINAVSQEDPGVYAILILRTIGLLRGADVKASSLINLSPENFDEDFRTAAHYLDKALERIRKTEGFGAFDAKWIPYPPSAVTLAALLHLKQDQKLDSVATHAINKWYWGSVFGERYSSSVETITASDYKDISGYLLGKKESSEVLDSISRNVNAQYLRDRLYETNRARSSIYCGVVCLLASNGATDFRLEDSITFHALDDHHIFPKDYLAKSTDAKYTNNQINCVLNKTLITDRTNRMISNKAPSKYLTHEQIIDLGERSIILKSHFISDEGARAMLEDNFTDFQEARADIIISKILEKIA